MITGREFGERDDLCELVGIMQKILAERFCELNAAVTQELPDFRELHSIACWRAATLARSWASVIVSGGVKEMTFECSPSGRKIKPLWSRFLIAPREAAVAGAPELNF